MFRPRAPLQRRRQESVEDLASPETAPQPIVEPPIEEIDCSEDDTVFEIEPSEASAQAEVFAVDPSEFSDAVSLSSASTETVGPSSRAREEFRRRVAAERQRLLSAPNVILQLTRTIQTAEQTRSALADALSAVRSRNIQDIEATVMHLQQLYPNEYEQASLGAALTKIKQHLSSSDHK
jgi:hypothetical protein